MESTPVQPPAPMGNYLDIINRDEIALDRRWNLLSESKELFTQNPMYEQQITEARKKLKAHFNGPSRSKPLNCLVLGPPGSGKSTLVKSLVAGTYEGGDIWRKTFNLSQFGSFADIKQMFEDITRENSLNSLRPGMVLVDEFDVRIGGASAIQALISPIYDRDDFRNIAFVFAGSYLKSRKMLGSRLDAAMEFDLRRCLAVYRIYTSDPEDRKLLAELDEIYWRMEQKEVRDPDQGIINYLSGLEKLIDFRSRINGFVIEIPDLDAPLDVTLDPFLISKPQGSRRMIPSPAFAEQLVAFVNSSRIDREAVVSPQAHYRRRDDAVYQFQNMLLNERLIRVMIMVRNSRIEKDKPIEISRSTLNYLVTVPVRHGMRSVEFLISNCGKDSPDSPLRHIPPSADMQQLHIRNFSDFPNDLYVWNKLIQANPTKKFNKTPKLTLTYQ